MGQQAVAGQQAAASGPAGHGAMSWSLDETEPPPVDMPAHTDIFRGVSDGAQSPLPPLTRNSRGMLQALKYPWQARQSMGAPVENVL